LLLDASSAGALDDAGGSDAAELAESQISSCFSAHPHLTTDQLLRLHLELRLFAAARAHIRWMTASQREIDPEEVIVACKVLNNIYSLDVALPGDRELLEQVPI
jgi:hypothetical protein